MGYKKSFLVVITAFVLVCAIPISGNAISISDSDMQTYRPYDKTTGQLIGEFPAVGVWYQFYGSGYQSCGIYDSGNPTYAFIIWVPLRGYFLISIQSMEMKYQLKGHVSANGYNFDLYGTLYIQKNTEGLYQNTYYNWRGTGAHALEYDSHNHFQTAFLNKYIVFHKIYTPSNNGSPSRSASENYVVPSYQEPTQNVKDKIISEITSIFGGTSSAVEFLGGESSEGETFPDGTPVPTNDEGNPAPTDQFGQPVETLNNGMPYPTYPNGEKASTYVDSSGNVQTVPYTIVDNGSVQNDVNNEFGKINSMISDLDNASSLMESNQDELSAHVDNTRDIVDDILSWFPAPLIAVLVCGVIMIIAVKITGSGASV